MAKQKTNLIRFYKQGLDTVFFEVYLFGNFMVIFALKMDLFIGEEEIDGKNIQRLFDAPDQKVQVRAVLEEVSLYDRQKGELANVNPFDIKQAKDFLDKKIKERSYEIPAGEIDINKFFCKD